MAGPACCILVHFEGRVPSWREILSPYADTCYGEDDVSISDVNPFGGNYRGEPRPFVGSVDDYRIDAQEYPEEASERELIAKHLSLDITHEVIVAAMCNRQPDHHILCVIAADIAERYNGCIDFDRLDVPEGLLEVYRFRTGQDEYNWTTLGTPAGARNWLSHPEFRMLK